MNKDHIGSNFDDFLKEEGILEEAERKVKEEMNKPEYFYELACCNCSEKDRCLEQKEKKESLINALFSYIENESNKKTIGEIKNQIPTLIRCDVVLEKQLQRLKAENEKLKAENEELKRKNTILELVTEPQREEIQKYRDKALQFKQVLVEVRKVIDSECSNCVKLYHSCAGHCCGVFNVNKILKEMDEVLKDE